VDKDGKRRARIVITDLMEPGAESPKYEFEMELALRETGRGR
jgi:F-box protein 9